MDEKVRYRKIIYSIKIIYKNILLLFLFNVEPLVLSGELFRIYRKLNYVTKCLKERKNKKSY